MIQKDPHTEYASEHRRIANGLEDIRVGVDAWLADLDGRSPTMIDLAKLEGFNALRAALQEDLSAANAIFLDALLKLSQAPESG